MDTGAKQGEGAAQLKLYNYWRSSASWRVRIALHHKGLAFEYVPVHLTRGGGEQHSATFKQLNPMKHVPVLSFEAGGKTHYVAESLAIIELLEEMYPDAPLLPSDPFLRARVRQLSLLVASGIQPLVNTKVQVWVHNQLHSDERAWVRHWVMSGLEALEESLAHSAGRYAVGDEVTLADVCLVPQLYMARRVGAALDGYPTVLAIESECRKLEAFQKAEPDRQPDAEQGA